MTLTARLAIAAACVSAACGGSTTLTEVTTGPGPVRCQTAVSAPPQTVPSSGTNVTLTVLAARECSWNAASEASWVRVSPATGQGEAPLALTVSANPQGRPRSTTVVVNDNRIAISQEAAPCRFQLSGTATMGYEGGRANLRVSATEGCDWRATSNAAWARLLQENGTGTADVPVEVARNDGPARSATLSVAGVTHTLLQDGFPTGGPAPPPGPGPEPPPPDEEGQKVELEGRAFLVAGSCPDLTFLVNFRRVFTTGSTKFKEGPCSRIADGVRVSVQGKVQADGSVRANEVRFDDDDD